MFTFAMRLANGSPADPPTVVSAIPGSEVRFQIVGFEVPSEDLNGIWIVEPVPSGHLAT